ncbi:MAG TPA: hypothetical protein VM822_16080 [Pseudolabrys sp.]|jgi:hypothetical protein|nr:hypothetical protein [Pseudolabrys sp.]
MSDVKIIIEFDMGRNGHRFEVRPTSDGEFDPAEVGFRVCSSLLDSAVAIMSSSGLAKWQIIENLECFIADVESMSTAKLAKSLTVISQQ